MTYALAFQFIFSSQTRKESISVVDVFNIMVSLFLYRKSFYVDHIIKNSLKTACKLKLLLITISVHNFIIPVYTCNVKFIFIKVSL